MFLTSLSDAKTLKHEEEFSAETAKEILPCKPNSENHSCFTQNAIKACFFLVLKQQNR